MRNVDYAELQRLIRGRGKTQKALAAEIGVSEWQLSRKLHGESEFCLGEIDRIVMSLDLSEEDFCRCFYRSEK